MRPRGAPNMKKSETSKLNRFCPVWLAALVRREFGHDVCRFHDEQLSCPFPESFASVVATFTLLAALSPSTTAPLISGLLKLICLIVSRFVFQVTLLLLVLHVRSVGDDSLSEVLAFSQLCVVRKCLHSAS